MTLLAFRAPKCVTPSIFATHANNLQAKSGNDAGFASRAQSAGDQNANAAAHTSGQGSGDSKCGFEGGAHEKSGGQGDVGNKK